MKRGDLYDGKEYEFKGRLFEVFWMDHVGDEPCEYAVMCMDVPGQEEGVCIGFVPCTATDDYVYSVIAKNFRKVDSSDSRVDMKKDGLFVEPMSKADRLYWVVGIQVHPSLAHMSDYEIMALERERGKHFERVNYACYENMEDAIAYAKVAGTPTKRIIGVVCNHRYPDGSGYRQGEYVWRNLERHGPDYDRKKRRTPKGLFPLFGKRKV